MIYSHCFPRANYLRFGSLPAGYPPLFHRPRLSPTEIITCLRARDPAGLEALFEQYAAALNGVIRRIVRDERVAEEVLQDTLLKAWNKIDVYDEDTAGLFAWLVIIARHTAIDRVRLKGYQRARKSVELDAHVHDVAGEATSAAALDIEALTTGLEAKYRDVLAKVYFEGHSASTAAEALNLPVGTVKTRLRAALKSLRHKVISDKRVFFGTFLVAIASACL